MRVAFRLFGRLSAPSSERAIQALKEYCAVAEGEAHCEIIDVDERRDLIRKESVVIIPLLEVRARGIRRRLTHGLFPLEALKKQLDKLLEEMGKGSKPPSNS